MGLEQYKTLQTTADVAALLGELSARLGRLEGRLTALESRLPAAGTPSAGTIGVSVSGSGIPTQAVSSARELLLAPADEQIITLIRARGHVCALDVQMQSKYRGKNAASARLSRLYELGLLEKQQAGRTVYYRMRSPEI